MVDNMKHYTRNEINRRFKNVIAIPYCDAEFLLKPYDRIGYNAGVLGWNFDVFEIGNTAILTGYRNMTGTRPDRDILKDYETRARAIYEDRARLDYEKQLVEIKELLWAFIDATV